MAMFHKNLYSTQLETLKNIDGLKLCLTYPN